MSIATRITSIEGHIEQAYDELQGLGADLTNVNKNIENISMVLDNIYDSMPQVSGEGTSLTLDDTRVGKIKSTLKGNTSQTGTPTPSSPIPVNVVSGDNEIVVNGKNSYNINVNYDWIGANTTYTITGNTINVNGKYFVASLHNVKPNTNYTISASRQIIQDNSACGTIRAFTPDKSQMLGEGKTTFTFNTGNNSQIYVLLYAGLNQQGDINYSNIQLEKGSSASTFEPYQGNTYNINLPVENLWNEATQTFANHSRFNNPTKDSNNVWTFTISGTDGYAYASSTISLGAGTYTVSAIVNNGDFLLQKDGSTINNTFTLTETSTITFRVYKNGVVGDVVKLSNVMFEKGSKANSYTPYGTTPIEMCSNSDGTIRDTFRHDKVNDIWYKDWGIGKFVANGSETGWGRSGSSSNDVFVGALNLNQYGIGIYSKGGTGSSWLVNRFSYGTLGALNKFNVYNPDPTYGYNNIGFGISTDIVNDIDAFKTWVSSNNIVFYYPLATTTSTQITYQPLIDQLNAIEKAQSKENQTNISQVNNDLPFIISASALKEWQESASLSSTLSMVNPLSLGNTLSTQEDNIQPIEVDNIEPLEEEENEES